MAATTTELMVRLVADTKGFAAELGSATRDIDTLSTKATQMGTAMQAAGRRMSLGFTLPVVAGFAFAIKAATDLQESQNKVNVIFKDGSAVITRWADGAARDFGQSKQQALDAAGSFGNMFNQFGIGQPQVVKMSKAMVELASDFASFHNADITEVLIAQQAAFRGEYDSLQRFVPQINAAAVAQKALEMTGKATTAELTMQEKALATYQLMMEGAGKAVGDFDRTSDSAANRMRTAQATLNDSAAQLGAIVLPVFADIVGLLAKIAEWFGNLPEPVQQAILIFGAFVAAAGPVLWVTGSIIRNVTTIIEVVGKMGGSLGSSVISMGAWGLAIGLAAGAAYGLAQAIAGDTLELDGLVEAAMRATDAQMRQGAAAILAKGGIELFTVSVRQLAAESTTTARALVEASDLNEKAKERLLNMIEKEEAATGRAEARRRADAEAMYSQANAADRLAGALGGVARAHFSVPSGQLQSDYNSGSWDPVYGYGFASGGVIPGPLGAPRMAKVHGGEAIFNPDQLRALSASGFGGGGGGNVYNVSIDAQHLSPDQVAEAFQRWQRRNGG